MKILLIIYNILFLFIGNDIFIQINHCHHNHDSHNHAHHSHEHHHNEDKEKVDFHNCDECMNFNNDENFVDSFHIQLFRFNVNKHTLENTNTIAHESFYEYYKRGPPQV